ncbi:hypothetical protein SAMN05660816_01557 [Niastella yeongjuensis]|nr:hypothetical protein SAMN05660816_01557 [Niastella yeongjuensis]
MTGNFRFLKIVIMGMPATETYYFIMELLLVFNKHLYLVKCGKQLTWKNLRN